MSHESFSEMTPLRVIEVTAAIHSISANVLRGNSRTSAVSHARWMAMAMMRQVWPATTLERIGKEFGGRDHSTISYGLGCFQRLLDSELATQHRWNELCRRLGIEELGFMVDIDHPGQTQLIPPLPETPAPPSLPRLRIILEIKVEEMPDGG